MIVDGAKEYRAFTEGQKLPSKLEPWYIYAYDFIEVFRLKTPKVVCKTKMVVEVEGEKVRMRLEAVLMIVDNYEVTIRMI